MITCTTSWLSLALIVTFPDATHITIHHPDKVRAFMISCGYDPDEDDPLDIDECPTRWSSHPVVRDYGYRCDREVAA